MKSYERGVIMQDEFVVKLTPYENTTSGASANCGGGGCGCGCGTCGGGNCGGGGGCGGK